MKMTIHTEDDPKTISMNRRKAIRDRCLNCSTWSTKDVQHCTMKDCALYPYRMGKGKQNPKTRNKAIRAYCLWCCAGQPKEVRLCPSADCSLHHYRMSEKNHQDAILSQENTTGKGVFNLCQMEIGNPTPEWEELPMDPSTTKEHAYCGN